MSIMRQGPFVPQETLRRFKNEVLGYLRLLRCIAQCVELLFEVEGAQVLRLFLK